MVDAAASDDGNIVTTEAWKIERYQEGPFLVRRIHWVEVVLVPLIIGALGTVSKNFSKWQEYLGILDVGLVGDSAYSQKGFPSMSCGRELRYDDVVYPARIESWRES